MKILFGKLKSYGIYILAGLTAVLYALSKYRGAKVEALKQKARSERIQAKLKQREQINKTLKATRKAHEEGEKRLEQVKQDIASGKRRGFGQLRE